MGGGGGVQVEKQCLAYFHVHKIRDVWDLLLKRVGVAAHFVADAIYAQAVP